jgi:hypothetical protein
LAYALVTSDSAGAAFPGDSVTTAGVDTSGSDFLALVACWNAAGTVTVSDSKSNTWTGLTVRSTGNFKVCIYYVQAPSVGSGHTFTVALSGSTPGVIVYAFSGSGSSPADQENGAGANTSNLSTGNITPTQNNELIITGLTNNGQFGGTIGVSSGYSTPIEIAFTGGTHVGSNAAYKVQTTATTTDATWDVQFGTDIAVAIASFKAPSIFTGYRDESSRFRLSVANTRDTGFRFHLIPPLQTVLPGADISASGWTAGP